jgi:hypothetical protein
MATNYHCLFHWNTTIEENNNALSRHHLLFKHRKKRLQHYFLLFCSDTKKKMTITCPSQTHRKQNTQKNNQKRNQDKKGNLPSSSRSALLFLALTSTLLLLHFCFKCFLLTSFSFQAQD